MLSISANPLGGFDAGASPLNGGPSRFKQCEITMLSSMRLKLPGLQPIESGVSGDVRP